MKSIRLLPLAITLLLALTTLARARAIQPWTYQMLLAASDLVVIATPTATNDTAEHIDLSGSDGQKVIGVETTFSVSAVLKGDKTQKVIVLHHYRPAPGAPIIPNAPTFVYFPLPADPSLRLRSYILFLHREADDRYAPVVGQIDSGLGIRELQGVYESAETETQTKLGLEMTRVLKECQTIKPGMTRAQLSKVFETEGGLSQITHRTFVYRDCSYIKVDVEFAPSAPNQDIEAPTDVVAKISKPYLSNRVSD